MFWHYLFGLSAASEFVDKHVRFDITTQPMDTDQIQIANLSDKAITANVANKDCYYEIELGIGTPPQKMSFSIDTGSSDLWVLSVNNTDVSHNASNATDASPAFFNSSASETFKNLHTPFGILYGDDSNANGTMVSDNIGIGGHTLKNAIFALAEQGNSSTCVFGIGFSQDESGAKMHANEAGLEKTYLNIPSMMKKEQLIYSNSYSLWLNDPRAKHGSIMFGAVDVDKYLGNMSVVPFYNNFQDFSERSVQLRIMLHGITLSDGLQIDSSIPVLIDSGTTLAYLPGDMVDAIANEINFDLDSSSQFYTGSTPGALQRVDNLRMNFSGAFIDIPLEDLLLPMTYVTENGTEITFEIDGEPQSMLGLRIADDEYGYILGDVFLRSMYAVFDLEHYEMGIAQTKPNVTTSNILPIIAHIPNAVIAPGYLETETSSLIHVHNTTAKNTATNNEPI